MAHFLVIGSYLACAALALGSFAPWTSGEFAYSGLESSGALTLAGAVVGAAGVWRWTSTRQRWPLVVTQVIAALGIAISLYAAYDAQEVYSQSAERWSEHLGWGLILTFVASLSLVLLCTLQFSQTKRKRIRRSGRLLAPIVLLVSVTATLSSASVSPADAYRTIITPLNSKQNAQLRDPIPPYAFNPVKGRLGRTSWSIWLFGRGHGLNCWGTRYAVSDESGAARQPDVEELAFCGMAVPPALWRLAARVVVGDGGDRRLVLFYVVRRDVRKVKLSLARGSTAGTTYSSLVGRTSSIASDKARKARLRPNFRYAPMEVRGRACIRRVTLLASSGRVLHKTPFAHCGLP